MSSNLQRSDVLWKISEEFSETFPKSVQRQNTLRREVVTRILNSPKTVHTTGKVRHSILDLVDARSITDEEISDIFSQYFKLNLSRERDFDKVNTYYGNVVQLYESRYGRPIPSNLKNKKFKSIDDIRWFLSATWKWARWIFRCWLAKVFLSYAKTMSEVRYASIEDIHEQIRFQVYRPFMINSEEVILNNWNTGSRFSWSIGSSNFDWYSRSKSLSSIVWKEIANIDYNTLEQQKDLHAFTFEFGDKHSLLLAMQQFYHSGVLDKSQIEHKYLFEEDDIDSVDWLSDEFKTVLCQAIKKSNTSEEREKRRKKGTWDKYRDVKIKGTMKFTDPNNSNSKDNEAWVEVKFVLKNNHNEFWTSFHPVLDCQKRIRELLRIDWWIIRVDDIVFLINDFFNNLDDYLWERRISREEYLRELLQDLDLLSLIEKSSKWNQCIDEKSLAIAFYRYLTLWLKKVKLDTKSKKHYYTTEEYLNKGKAWVIPELKGAA